MVQAPFICNRSPKSEVKALAEKVFRTRQKVVDWSYVVESNREEWKGLGKEVPTSRNL